MFLCGKKTIRFVGTVIETELKWARVEPRPPEILLKKCNFDPLQYKELTALSAEVGKLLGSMLFHPEKWLHGL